MRSCPLKCGLLVLLTWLGIPAALAGDTACEQTGAAHIWISPLTIKIDEPVKIMAVSTDGALSELALIGNQDHYVPLQSRHRGGPPWSLITGLAGLSAGDYRVVASRDGKPVTCQRITVGASIAQQRPAAWNLATEAFYSAWIEELFGAPAEENLGFNSLEPLLRNTERNFLHNHLGLGEDKSLPLTPDCADLPYT